jgi:Restriction endonuclease
MKNSGLELQKLVESIEVALVPAGFAVEANEKIFDESGVQIAEFDILVTGRIGSSELKWLIECRDRPSSGPAPVAWIEQLVGRRNRFNFDKVTAVSTTGFSPAAQGYASETGIDLRTVMALSHDAIRSWFAIQSMKLQVHRGELFHASICIEDSSSATLDAKLASQFVALQSSNTNLDIPILVCTDSGGGKHTIRDAWRHVMGSIPTLFDGIDINGPTRKRFIGVDYPDTQKRYRLEVDDESVDVIRIEYQANIGITEMDIPVSKVAEYSNTLGNESIAQSVTFNYATDDGKSWAFSLHKLQQSAEIAVTARCVPIAKAVRSEPE